MQAVFLGPCAIMSCTSSQVSAYRHIILFFHKLNSLCLHRNLSYPISKISKLLFVSQKRMVNRNTSDYFYFIISQFQLVLTTRGNLFPQDTILTHKCSPSPKVFKYLHRLFSSTICTRVLGFFHINPFSFSPYI